MSIAQLVKNTPIWVWVLLISLLCRGIIALFDREMRPGRIFLLPVLFLIWGIYSVVHETYCPSLSLIMMLAGTLVGAVAGWMMWWSQPPLRRSATPGLVVRSGTPLTLGIIIVAFSLKFILTSVPYLRPELGETRAFCIIFGLLTGFVDGIFWGGTLRLFVPWYRKRSSA